MPSNVVSRFLPDNDVEASPVAVPAVACATRVDMAGARFAAGRFLTQQFTKASATTNRDAAKAATLAYLVTCTAYDTSKVVPKRQQICTSHELACRDVGCCNPGSLL